MKTFLFLILSLFALTANAQQNYYEFGWNNQYGIVDKDGNETLPPSYQWVSRLIDNESPFIVLNGNKGAVITNKQTGKMEKIDYLIDTYLISIDKKDYMYAHSSGNGFLLNNLDLDSRIKLPKKYIKVRDEGDYLTGFTSKKTIDFISKKDFEARHNSIYWENKNYLGLGLSAAGYLGNLRYKNFFHLKDYYDKLDKNILPVDEREELTEDDIEQYRYLVGFRLLNNPLIPSKEYLEKCEILEKEAYLVKKENGYILSSKGLMLFNDFIANFIDD